MKFLWKLLFGKPAKAKEPKKKKKSLLPALMDKLLSLPLIAIKNKWTENLWKPDGIPQGVSAGFQLPIQARMDGYLMVSVLFIVDRIRTLSI